MKALIDFIISKEKEDFNEYFELVKPISEKFNIDEGVAKGIVSEIVDWESSEAFASLEEVLRKKFPTYVTKLS